MKETSNKDNVFVIGVSELERESEAKQFYSPMFCKNLGYLNIGLNLIVCAFCSYFLEYNILKIAVCFIIFDIICGFIDTLVCHIYPYYKQNLSLSQKEKELKKVENKFKYYQEKIDDYRNENCNDCHYFNKYIDSSYNHCSANNPCTLELTFRFYRDKLKELKKEIESEKSKIEEEQIELVNKTKNSKDYSDKAEYFKDKRDVLKLYINKKDMPFLIPILKVLNELNRLLEKKPIGYSLIPNTLYIYLDELVNIISKWSTLDKTRKEMYLESIEKVSKALTENIESLKERINNFEEEDIEVGLNVLLSELIKEKEENKNV